jgi:hypothetical protein
MIRTLTLAIVLVAAACGGKKSAPDTTTTTSTAQPVGGSDEHKQAHADMPAEMTKFHDVLAPRWHAEKGPKRMADTCAAVPEMKAVADAIAKATPPTRANADTWTASTRALVASLNELEPVCKANDATKFEAAFHKVHESFHGLMAAGGVSHGEHQGDEHRM